MSLADLPPLPPLPKGIQSPTRRIVRKTSSEELFGKSDRLDLTGSDMIDEKDGELDADMQSEKQKDDVGSMKPPKAKGRKAPKAPAGGTDGNVCTQM